MLGKTKVLIAGGTLAAGLALTTGAVFLGHDGGSAMISSQPSVQVLDQADNPVSVVHPGEVVRIRTTYSPGEAFQYADSLAFGDGQPDSDGVAPKATPDPAHSDPQQGIELSTAVINPSPRSAEPYEIKTRIGGGAGPDTSISIQP
jgi:hypothetical protein